MGAACCADWFRLSLTGESSHCCCNAEHSEGLEERDSEIGGEDGRMLRGTLQTQWAGPSNARAEAMAHELQCSKELEQCEW